MPDFDVYSLPESEITISGGGQLSGITQGDGTHLLGLDITLNSNAWEVVTVTDSENFFADSDSSQSLTNTIDYDGTTFTAGRRVEAEYQLFVETPDGTPYTLIGFNINEPGVTSFATVEGLTFVGDRPPLGVPLRVISVSEGPRATEIGYDEYFVPPCFVEGTRIETPTGAVPVESLSAGDLVTTLDHGPRPVKWIGHVTFTRKALEQDARLRPIEVATKGQPLRVSPQHRVFFGGWRAEMTCGEDVLVAAKHVAEAGRARSVRPEELGPEGVQYWHILFDRHEIVFSEGIPTESFCPGDQTRRSMPKAHAEFARFFPEMLGDGPGFETARRCANRHESLLVAEGF